MVRPEDVRHPGESFDEIDYVSECPACGTDLVGMDPVEFRETHAIEECPHAPHPALVVFPTDEQLEKLQKVN